MSINQNVVVITHRRSGTHLTIDALRNNFSALRRFPLLVLETLHPNHPKHISYGDMSAEIQSGQRVIKTHYRCADIDHIPKADGTLFRTLLNNSKLVYVVRNGLDVMASLYEFRKAHDPSVREISFSDFIRQPTFDPNYPGLSKVEYWHLHVRGWLDSEWGQRLTIVRFEDWANDYVGTLKRLGKELELRRDWRRKDVRIQNGTQGAELDRTWVEPRKGIIGDYINYFSPADLDYFWGRCDNLMKRLGYGDFFPQKKMRAQTKTKQAV